VDFTAESTGLTNRNYCGIPKEMMRDVRAHYASVLLRISVMPRMLSRCPEGALLAQLLQ
jgi:hypothetical protein